MLQIYILFLYLYLILNIFDVNSYRNSFVNSQFTIGMKYQYKSNSSIILNRRIHTNRGYPEFMTSLTKGIKGILGSDFDFLKLNIGIQQTFYAQNLGTTSYHVMGGILNKSLPLGLLYEGRGSYDKSIPFIIKDHFRVRRPDLALIIDHQRIDLC